MLRKVRRFPAEYLRQLSLSLLALALAAAPALAQTGTVTGQVTNAAGQPLPGAQVAVEGTTLGGLTIEAGGTAVRDFVLQLTALSMDEIVSDP